VKIKGFELRNSATMQEKTKSGYKTVIFLANLKKYKPLLL